jgi:hypothetical protein
MPRNADLSPFSAALSFDASVRQPSLSKAVDELNVTLASISAGRTDISAGEHILVEVKISTIVQ